MRKASRNYAERIELCSTLGRISKSVDKDIEKLRKELGLVRTRERWKDGLNEDKTRET